MTKKRQVLIILIINFIKALVFIPVFIVLMLWFTESLQLSFNFFSVLVVLSLIYIVVITASLVIYMRNRLKINKYTSIINDKIIQVTSTIIAMFFIMLLTWEVAKFRMEKPYKPFPINDPNATYTLIKYDTEYGLKYHSDAKTEINKTKDCTWVNRKLECQITYNLDANAIIGYSPVNLSEFVNKEVTVDGSFGVSGNGASVVFNIKSIYEK